MRDDWRSGASGLLAAGALAFGWVAGCGGTSDEPEDHEHVQEDAGVASSAYLIGLRVHTMDERFIYMGAFPEVPTTEPSTERMVELAGHWQLTGFDGSAFAWEQETARMTRWTVDENLDLHKGQTMSLSNLGLEGWRYHAFISSTRAYTLGLEDGVVAVWNPETMELVDEIRFEPPEDFADMDAYPLSVFVRGDLVFVPMYGDNWDAQQIVTKQIVGVIDTTTDEVRFISDERCLASGLAHLSGDGDLYLDPYQSGTYFTAYGAQSDLPPPCTLRIKAGEDRFDPEYVLDYEALLGRHADGVWPISGDLVMALSTSLDAPLPSAEKSDAYWSLPQTAHVINVVTRSTEPYAGMPEDLQMQSAGQHVAGGVSYYQNYRYHEDGNIDVVEVGALTPSGWQKRFEIHGGDLWSIVKLR